MEYTYQQVDGSILILVPDTKPHINPDAASECEPCCKSTLIGLEKALCKHGRFTTRRAIYLLCNQRQKCKKLRDAVTTAIRADMRNDNARPTAVTQRGSQRSSTEEIHTQTWELPKTEFHKLCVHTTLAPPYDRVTEGK